MAVINRPYTVAVTNAAYHHGTTTNAWQLGNLFASAGLATIHNPSGSGLVVRVYCVRWANLQAVAASVANISFLEMWRVTSPMDGVPIPCIPWVWDGDRSINRLSVLANATSTPVSMFRRVGVSLDEYAYQGLDFDAWEAVPYLNIIWDAGMEDSNVDPITVRSGEGFEVRHYIDGSSNPSAFTPTALSLWIDFTVGVS